MDDLEAFALVSGGLAADRLADVIAHADACGACHELIEGLCAVDASEDAAPIEVRAGDSRIGVEVACAGYRIDALLAVGGMGRIYRAIDLELGREVALKVPRSRSPWLLRRFEREVAITARLQHPGVVPIHAAGRLPDGTPFYAMPIIEGVPLDVALLRAANREQRLALLEHLVAVANTMAYVHGERIAHRDLKPQNVLIGAHGETLIIDWGLAKNLEASSPLAAPPALHVLPATRDVPPTSSIAQVLAGRTTRPGDVLGTPAFMSPEQARGEDVDQRSDVYALGAMLEHLLTGRLPRKAAAAALAHAPPGLVAICRRAMVSDREHRYPDCEALAAELRSVTRPRLATSASGTFRPRPARRPIALAVAAGVAIGVALSQLGWS